MPESARSLLSVERLTTVFDLPSGPALAVSDVSFHVNAGETLCLVGESGSGKSVTALSIMRLVQPPGRIAGGRILFQGRDLLTLGEREMQKVRGAGIALVFQEPMTALNPVFTIGSQTRGDARVRIAKGCERTRGGAAGGGQHPDAPRRLRLSASVVGRPAPARAIAPRSPATGARHRRRADDRARRHDPGAILDRAAACGSVGSRCCSSRTIRRRRRMATRRCRVCRAHHRGSAGARAVPRSAASA